MQLEASEKRFERKLGVGTHASRFEQRPDISATVTADRANETALPVGQPRVIGP